MKKQYKFDKATPNTKAAIVVFIVCCIAGLGLYDPQAAVGALALVAGCVTRL